jgi:hypothetical protein
MMLAPTAIILAGKVEAIVRAKIPNMRDIALPAIILNFTINLRQIPPEYQAEAN